MSDRNLAEYYAERAPEYDAIYAKPERQTDIKLLAELLGGQLAKRRVLEIACGTGFWTQFYGPGSESVTATDCNPAVLDIASDRLAAYDHVRLLKSDAYRLDNLDGEFDAGLAAFWWSHLEKTRIAEFLEVFHRRLEPGSRVLFADNLYVDGSSTPLSRSDAEGNTYQRRALADGREYEVLKNFPDSAEFCNRVESFAEDIEFRRLTYFWCGSYRLK